MYEQRLLRKHGALPRFRETCTEVIALSTHVGKLIHTVIRYPIRARRELHGDPLLRLGDLIIRLNPRWLCARNALPRAVLHGADR